MRLARYPSSWAFLTLVFLAMLGSAGTPSTFAADETESLRARARKLNDVTGDNTMRGAAQMLIEDPAGTKKLLAVAVTMAKAKDQPFNYNAAYILASVALQLKDFDASRVFFRICAEQGTKLESGQKLITAYSGLLGLADLLYASKKYEESTKLCQEFLEMLEKKGVAPRLKAEVLRRMVRGLARQGKLDEATKLVDTLIKLREGDWRNLELKGWLQRESGKFGEAAKTYEELLEKVGKESGLEKEEREEVTTEVRYLLSGVYVDLNKIDEASNHLQTLLKEHPDDPTYNNDLGYIWADHGRNLDEAEKLIRKAIELDRKLKKANAEGNPASIKDNAAYLDSLGWVLFKQKKYKEAKPPLLEAVKDDKEGQNIEILDHLGDVHLALGEKAEAVAAWKKGVELAGTGKREVARKAEVEKKIKMYESK
jgi:tetratricopeptide (TPR) repeat protein